MTAKNGTGVSKAMGESGETEYLEYSAEEIPGSFRPQTSTWKAKL
jgi:hypothetical protein